MTGMSTLAYYQDGIQVHVHGIITVVKESLCAWYKCVTINVWYHKSVHVYVYVSHLSVRLPVVESESSKVVEHLVQILST